MGLTELANKYGWQLAFALDWAQRSGFKFENEEQLISLYFSDIELSLKQQKVRRLADEMIRQLSEFTVNPT